MCRKINKLARNNKQKRVEEGTVEMSGVLEPSSTTDTKSIPTPKLTRPQQNAKPKIDSKSSYENAEIVQNSMEKSTDLAWIDSGKYTDVSGPLPGFLRNEDMLVVPTVSEDVLTAARRDFEESYTLVSSKNEDLKPKNQSLDDTYMDPQDAMDKVFTTRTHEKLDKRVSKSTHSSDVSSDHSSPKSSKKIALSEREDYSEVSDALPESSFKKFQEMRGRTTSDTSPMKGSPIKGSPSPNLKKKSQSLLHRQKPQHLVTTEGSSQPLKRRSSAQKELVSFDPDTGFKLAAKRTSSDSAPRPSNTDVLINNTTNSAPSSQQNSPTEDTKKKVLDIFDGTGHIYAAVDITAKCRPEEDLIRREGVGTPDHYVACV